MIAKTLTAAAVLAFAGSASAQFLTTSHTATGSKVAPTNDSYTTRGGWGPIVDVDITGVTTFDFEGSALNTVMLIDIGALSGVGAPVSVTGIGWDVIQSSIGASWGSEMKIGFGTVASPNDIILTTSGTGAPVASEVNSSGGIVDISAIPIPNLVLADGILRLEFFETYLDNGGTGDGVFEDPSVLHIAVPAPGAAGLLAVAGVGVLRRKRR